MIIANYKRKAERIGVVEPLSHNVPEFPTLSRRIKGTKKEGTKTSTFDQLNLAIKKLSN